MERNICFSPFLCLDLQNMELDEAIESLKKEIDQMEEDSYRGMSIIEVIEVYQKLIDHMWLKMQILLEKDKNK